MNNLLIYRAPHYPFLLANFFFSFFSSRREARRKNISLAVKAIGFLLSLTEYRCRKIASTEAWAETARFFSGAHLAERILKKKPQEEAETFSLGERGKHRIASHRIAPDDPCITFIALSQRPEFSVHGVVSKRICNQPTGTHTDATLCSTPLVRAGALPLGRFSQGLTDKRRLPPKRSLLARAFPRGIARAETLSHR